MQQGLALGLGMRFRHNLTASNVFFKVSQRKYQGSGNIPVLFLRTDHFCKWKVVGTSDIIKALD